MSFLKRIFGNGNAESDSRIEKEIEQVKEGMLNKVYPILKPSDWAGIQAGALKQTMLGSQEEPQLVIAFGYDTPSNFVFLMPSDLKDKDPNQVLREAYQNLEEFESEFEVITDSDGTMLAASGKDFSSEKILCKSHLMKAHALLQADELLVSIPRRTCMMIAANNSVESYLNKFLAVHEHTWDDDSYGNAPIINALFVVREGEIISLIPM